MSGRLCVAPVVGCGHRNPDGADVAWELICPALQLERASANALQLEGASANAYVCRSRRCSLIRYQYVRATVCKLFFPHSEGYVIVRNVPGEGNAEQPQVYTRARK